MSIFTGAGVALITPMNPDGSINYPEMEHIINDQIASDATCSSALTCCVEKANKTAVPA